MGMVISSNRANRMAPVLSVGDFEENRLAVACQKVVRRGHL
jgi:hypothetical protein